MTIQIKKKYLSELKKSLKGIAGFKGAYSLTDAQNAEDNVEMQVIFTKLNSKSHVYLESFLRRRKAKIVDSMKENNGIINPESKKALRNSMLAFSLTFVSTIFSVNIISPQFELAITFYESLAYGVGPSLGAFLANLIIHYKT